MRYLKIFLSLSLIVLAISVQAQITAPSSNGSFTTTYSPGYLGEGGTNDVVYLFCGEEGETNIGELELNTPGCDIEWYFYDGLSFVELGQSGATATNLVSGFYLARQDCGGTIECFRTWVWVNQTFVDVDPIPEGCQTFELTGSAEVIDNTFEINDPPGSDFIVNANTYIKVCFWAQHTYVSDIGFYLKSPGNQGANPPADGVVQLCPPPSNWGPTAEFPSWTGIPWSSVGCSTPSDENTNCNPGYNVSEFCFQTHSAPGGAVIPAGNPSNTPCICDLPTPLTGNFGSVGPWTTIYGSSAATPGWSVQIYDCEGQDIGSLTQSTITFIGETECGTATFEYASGDINSAIADESCDAATASVFVVPPGEPQGSYTVSSSITSTEWSSIPAGFTSSSLEHQIIAGSPGFPSESTEYILTVVETIDVAGNPSCEHSSAETFVTLPADATITPVDPMCTNEAPVQLVTADGGGTWTTDAPAGSIDGGYFYPEIAQSGEWTLTYTITGPCEDTDQITIEVYDNIEVLNFSDDVCSGDNTEYYVTFDVQTLGGSGATFYVDLGTGPTQFNDNYAGTFTSNTIYNITVTDPNGCDEYEFHGLTNCGCQTDAGDMNSLLPVNLCANECTDAVTHDGTQDLDGDDAFEFAIHDGNYPADIYARNTTPEFCFTDIPSGTFGTTYYVSAICGNDAGGHVSQIDPCYSQSIGTPIIWFENPIAFISETDVSTCGLNITLEATPPTSGMTGSWSANDVFVPTGGLTINDPVIDVMASDYGDVVFTWTIYNGVCSGSDNITAHFNQTPSAFAGEDYTTCGNIGSLEAVLSIPSSTGQWSGSGSFDVASDPTTEVTSSYGAQVFTWRENQGACWDEDYVTVTFIQEPTPTTISNFDTICSTTYNLNVYNNIHAGYWTAYTGEPLELMTPAPLYLPSNTDPNAEVTIGNYPGLHKDVLFIWTETNQVNGVECTNEALTNVTFAKQPVASVGASNESEICGSCIQLAADTIGSGWAYGTWISKDVLGEFDDPELPNAIVCVDSLGSYGDTAYVRAPFLWVMRNYGCSSVDTMYVTFYDQPEANAGIDGSICGNVYDLGAVYDITETVGYSPQGWWETYIKPDESANVNIEHFDSDTTSVSVSMTGVYEFVFRESNANLTACYDTDTVMVEFVESPIISAGDDYDVCGTNTNLPGISGGFDGSWLPNGAAFIDPYDPITEVNVSAYGPIGFTWLESNQATTSTLSCSAQDEVIVTFWRIPTANILTDEADSTICGYTFNRLRAELSGTGITGYWYDASPATIYGDRFSNDTWATVPTYGYHDFYWIEENGPDFAPGYCNDTAGPLTIHFIEIPEANAGIDTLFCGLSGFLDAAPSVGGGVWSTPSTVNISFDDANDENTLVTSTIINTGNPTNPDFELIWTEDNSNGCTDSDTMKVIFARIPDADLHIIPPKCFGEPATIAAVEDSLQQYTWNFYNGVVDDTVPANGQGGYDRHFVYWNSEDTLHQVSLVAMNSFNCQSVINIDTVFEPKIPEFDFTMISDTCLLGKGGIIFTDTLDGNSFFWLDENIGPDPGPITSVFNIPEGTYDIRTSYLSFNTTHYAYYLITFGSPNCVDTIQYEIEAIGMIEAEIEVSADIILNDLVAPNANVIFLNNSDYDDVSKRCEWHFGDELIEKNCDALVEHIYTEAGCYDPFLIVMNRDLPECRDTAILDACIRIENASKLEVPNVFSPNGDGTNDFFQVKAQTLNTFSGTIVNRWGRSVFTWENWEDYEAGWDGKLNGGTNASSGVYYYIIRAVGMDEVEYNVQGPLHLFRD